MRSIATFSPANIAVIDDNDPKAGGAAHVYAVQFGGPGDILRIQFQHGPRAVEGSVPGCFDDDLLAIVEDRMASFQAGPYSCDENEQALNSIRSARLALAARVAERIKRGVLGTNSK